MEYRNKKHLESVGCSLWIEHYSHRGFSQNSGGQEFNLIVIQQQARYANDPSTRSNLFVFLH